MARNKPRGCLRRITSDDSRYRLKDVQITGTISGDKYIIIIDDGKFKVQKTRNSQINTHTQSLSADWLITKVSENWVDAENIRDDIQNYNPECREVTHTTNHQPSEGRTPMSTDHKVTSQNRMRAFITLLTKHPIHVPKDKQDYSNPTFATLSALAGDEMCQSKDSWYFITAHGIKIAQNTGLITVSDDAFIDVEAPLASAVLPEGVTVA
jgi:hypothetical protein